MAFFRCSKQHPTAIEYYGCCCLLLLTDLSGLLVVVALAIVFGGRLNDSQRAALTGFFYCFNYPQMPTNQFPMPGKIEQKLDKTRSLKYGCQLDTQQRSQIEVNITQ